MISPVCLFTYNRLQETQQSVGALRNNFLAGRTDLYVFSDGGKDECDQKKVNEVRQYLETINGFASVQFYFSDSNRGLANSVISGVTSVINEFGRVIVLEDDLVTSPNFLSFMNEALDFFENNSKIFSISGYTLNLPSLNGYHHDYYLGYRASSWGWATWKDRWNTIDWQVGGWQRTLLNPLEHVRFMRGGSDMPYMLWKQMNGKVDSWAIRWCYQQFCNDQLTVFPSESKVKNIGFGENATHTKNLNRFLVDIDNGEKFHFFFSNTFQIEKRIINEFRRKYSIMNRLIARFY